MTGNEFESLMKDNGYSQTTLGARWGVVRQTIASICKAESVDPIYADAIKTIAYEKQADVLLQTITLFNTEK